MAKEGLIVGHTDDTPFILECITPKVYGLEPCIATLGIINSHLRGADNPTAFIMDDGENVKVFAPYDNFDNPTANSDMSISKLISLIRESSKMMSKYYGDKVYILSKSFETHNIFLHSIIGT